VRIDLAVASVLGRAPIGRVRQIGKRRAELAYWRERRGLEGGLEGYHYERFFTEYFGLSRAFYAGKRVLDIGCGPRGTLEWADEAEARVGLDPLANEYRRLGAAAHRMAYVAGSAERMPFAERSFDVIASFNSLDHVDSLDQAIGEITRVARPGALLLLLTDVGHDPTFTEPQTFGWDIVERFAPAWEPEWSKRIAKTGAGMMEDLDADLGPPDDAASGYLAAVLRRNEKPA
jgi:SAM-dependent methyltransferase